MHSIVCMLFRRLTELELNRTSDFLVSVVRCRPDELPIEAFVFPVARQSPGLVPAVDCRRSTGPARPLDENVENVCRCNSTEMKSNKRYPQPSIAKS